MVFEWAEFWLESGVRVYTHHSQEIESINDDTNVDIWVEFPTGVTWVGTVYTCKSFHSIMEKNRKTDEPGRLYCWDVSYVVVDAVSKELIPKIVAELITTGNLMHAFQRIDDN